MRVLKGISEIRAKSSKGIMMNSWNKKDDYYPEKNLKEFLDIYKEDPIVNAAIKTTIDSVLGHGFTVKAMNNEQLSKKAQNILDKLKFQRVLRKILFQLLIYQNVFIEIEREIDSDKPKALHVLETTEMKIEADEHGEIIEFIQVHGDKQIRFSPDDIVYIPLIDITSKIWGDIDIQSLTLTVDSKNIIESFIYYLFNTNKFRDTFNFEDASDDQVINYMSILKESEDKKTMPIVTNGKFQHGTLRNMEEIKDLTDLLNYYRSQILIQMQVPPIMVGLPDNSNRSNSETQVNKAFNSRITALQDVIEDYVNNELFTKIGLSNAILSFNYIDFREVKDKIEIIGKLKDMGIDKESLKQYALEILKMNLPPTFKFEEPQVNPIDNSPNSGKTLYPKSREPEDKSAPVKHKVGSDSTTRDEQLQGKSYDFEIIDQYAEAMEHIKNRD